MMSLQTEIALYDQMTSTLGHITNSMNVTLSAFNELQNSAERGINPTSVQAARAELQQAQIEIMNMSNSIKPVEIPAPIWASDGFEVFKNTGIERFESEISSAQSMINNLADSQERLRLDAKLSGVFDDNAMSDLTHVQHRLSEINEAINLIESNPMNFESDIASAELEKLRGQLTSITSIQDNLNDAVGNMDIAKANQMYTQLNHSIGNTERYIRDNIDSQGKFNQIASEVKWSSGIEVFKNTGVERFQSEINSTQMMLTELTKGQHSINLKTINSDIFDSGAINDLTLVQERMKSIQKQISVIEANPLNLESEVASAELERLRSQLNGMLTTQENLNHAVNNMDISGANKAYLQLNQSVNDTERYIRDNVDEQGRFTREVVESEQATNGLMSKIGAAVAAYATLQSMQKLVNVSDEMSLNSARLSLIVDDGGSIEALEQEIFNSAQRSRSAYMDVSASVAKLGITAGDAFSGTDEIIAFTELLNKNLVVGGAGAQEQASAMYQLTQAMASGRLQGDEYRSIIENAPLLAKSIEDYMRNVEGATGQMKDWASEGLLTSDVIKNAMFNAAEETNAQFESMPMTWGQVWTGVMNQLLFASQPVLDMISFLAQHWQTLEPIVVGVAAGVLFFAAAMGIQTLMTSGAIVAMQTFFTTLLANPFTWIALAIGVVIYALYRWVKSVGGVKIAWLIALNAIKNGMSSAQIFLTGALNKVERGLRYFVLGFTIAKNGILNVLGYMKVGALTILQEMINGAIGYINDFITKLNMIPGININTVAEVTFAAKANAEEEAARQAGEAEIDTYKQGISDLKQQQDAELDNMRLKASYDKMGRELEIAKMQEIAARDQNASLDLSNYENQNLSGVDNLGGYGGGSALDGIAGDVSGINDELTTSTEDLKYLRDIAERDTVNRFTTAEIKIEQTNHNTVNGGSGDLAGIVEELSDGLEEALANGAHKAVAIGV